MLDAPHAQASATARQGGAPALRIAGLSAGYGAEPVLRDVSLRIDPGQAHCLLGSNGAGKTTLIRTILGRLRPREGTVRVAGLGLVPQDIALFPLLTVRENLATFARIAGVPRREVAGRVAQVAGDTGLSSRAGQRVGTLSGGWQRRVNIASAILHRPALLVLDEPTVGIDAEAREGLHAMIAGLVAGGLGLLITTHDLAEAEALCDHAIILDAGRVAARGPVAALVAERFGRSQILAVDVPAGQRAGHVLGARGFDLGAGRPSKLVSGESAAIEEVRALRAAGLSVSGMSLERPGLAALRHAVLRAEA